jgi:hypothetical protein
MGQIPLICDNSMGLVQSPPGYEMGKLIRIIQYVKVQADQAFERWTEWSSWWRRDLTSRFLKRLWRSDKEEAEH